jgi:hypothetical protein
VHPVIQAIDLFQQGERRIGELVKAEVVEEASSRPADGVVEGEIAVDGVGAATPMIEQVPSHVGEAWLRIYHPSKVLYPFPIMQFFYQHLQIFFLLIVFKLFLQQQK